MHYAKGYRTHNMLSALDYPLSLVYESVSENSELYKL